MIWGFELRLLQILYFLHTYCALLCYVNVIFYL